MLQNSLCAAAGDTTCEGTSNTCKRRHAERSPERHVQTSALAVLRQQQEQQSAVWRELCCVPFCLVVRSAHNHLDWPCLTWTTCRTAARRVKACERDKSIVGETGTTTHEQVLSRELVLCEPSLSPESSTVAAVAALAAMLLLLLLAH